MGAERPQSGPEHRVAPRRHGGGPMKARTLIMAGSLLLPAPVLAQATDASPRSAGAVFGSRRPNPKRQQSLEIVTTATGARDESGPGADAGLFQGAPTASPFFLMDINS